jgi:hypothetical protein
VAEVFTLDKGDMEEALDQAKAVVLISLVNEGLLSLEEAEIWASTHTVVLKKKSFFRTLTDRWKRTDDVQGHLMFVVSNPFLQLNLPPAGDDDGIKGNKLIDILDRIREENPDLDNQGDEGGKEDS